MLSTEETIKAIKDYSLTTGHAMACPYGPVAGVQSPSGLMQGVP